MFNRLSLLALTALGATAGTIVLDASAAIANSTPLVTEAFADKAVFYERGGSKNWGRYFGGADRSERWDVYDPNAALGRNNWTSEMTQRGSLGQWDKEIGVSLGRSGVLAVEFTDNYLSGNGTDTSDLWIFEIGGVAEKTFVEISVDGNTWYEVGIADRRDFKDDLGVGIDIDGLLSNHSDLNVDSLFSFVRLTDTGTNKYSNFKAGADIDAIAALSFKPKDPTTRVPEPGIIMALGTVSLGTFLSRKQG